MKRSDVEVGATVPGRGARQRSRAGGSADRATAGVPRLFRARPGDIWNFVRTQPLSFWGICFYLFVEYVRPQQVWPALDVLPWGLTAIALTGIAVIVEGRLSPPRTIIPPLLGIFTAIVFASALAAYSPRMSFTRIWEYYVSWVVIFFLIVAAVDGEKKFFTFMLLFLLCSFKMSQHGARTWAGIGFGFQDWGAAGAPGWFHNSGEFGIQMCVFLPLAVTFYLGVRHHWGRWTKLIFLLLPVTALMSIIGSSSRGALVGAALVLVWLVARSRFRVRAALGAIVLAAVVWAVIPSAQKDRLAAMGDDESSEHRLTMWEHGIEIARDNPVLGIGFSNWRTYYPTYGDGAHGLPHNIFIQAGAELGYTGLAAFLALIGATFFVNYRTRRIARSLPGDNGFLYQMGHGLDGALVGFIGSGFFVTVLYYPYFWINLAMTVALHTAARRKAARAGLRARVAAPRPAWHARHGRRTFATAPARAARASGGGSGGHG